MLAGKFQKLFSRVEWRTLNLQSKDFKQVLSQADLIVNATKVGLKESDPLLIPRSFFPKRRALVYDLIYKPRQTRLLKLARRLGHKIINGETMLLHQGAKAFEIWTGKRAPVHKMRKALQDALRSQ